MLSFQHLYQLRERGLSFSGILVYAYLKEHGVQPIQKVMKACDLSRSSAYAMMKKIEELALIEGLQLSRSS
ncbi:hypothetical protein D3C86_1323730 [compost metagenome]